MPRKTKPQLDLSMLPPDIASAVEAAIAGHNITVARSGKVIGELEFRSSVLDGLVLPTREETEPKRTVPAGATVIATAMELSDAARSKLSAEFGEGTPFLTSPTLHPAVMCSWCPQRALS